MATAAPRSGGLRRHGRIVCRLVAFGVGEPLGVHRFVSTDRDDRDGGCDQIRGPGRRQSDVHDVSLADPGDARREVAVGLPLAQAIGRLGNYFNQELFGTPSTLPWAVEIDANIAAAAGYPGFETFHPTFLYEALWNLFITVGIILLLERRGKLFKGSSIAVYMVLYGTGRFLMELMRTDTTFRFLGLSRNGWVSAGAVLIGAFLFWWMQQRREQRTLVGPPVFIAPGAETVPAMLESDEPGAGDVVANNADAEEAIASEEPESPPPS